MGFHRDVEHAAAAWLVRRESEEWSDGDQAQLEGWLSASTAHRVAFVRLQSAWVEAGRLKVVGRNGTLSTGKPREAAVLLKAACARSPASEVARHRFRIFNAPGIYVAACVALVAVFAVWAGWPQRANSYRTDVGAISAISINDGSTITLNTNSGIRVALSDTERRVDLEKGEAFFDVAKDPKRPFVVRIGNQRVIAVGTKFSVRRDRNDIRVIVTEGRVRLEHAGALRAPETAVISRGGVALAGADGVLVQDKPLTDVEERLSWRQGTLIFHDTPLVDAVAEFNRYNALQIAIEDSELGALRIGGQFRTNNATGFMRLLTDAFPVRIESNSTKIIIRHR